MKKRKQTPKCQPLLILGKSGTLGKAVSRICSERNIHHMLLSRADVDITDRDTMEQIVQELHPWAIINAAGYVRVDEAEKAADDCMGANCNGPSILAEICQKYSLKLVTFSTDLVFDGTKESPYVESDEVNPLNVYGQSKAKAEELILQVNPNALIIRTSSFFSPWDEYNFVTTTLADLKQGRQVVAANDVFISPTYVPDLVHETLDLLLDNQAGIYHITNSGETTWAGLAEMVADFSGCNKELIQGVEVSKMHLAARRPLYSVLQSEKGIKLPSLEHALRRYMEAVANVYQSGAIAV